MNFTLNDINRFIEAEKRKQFFAWGGVYELRCNSK